MNNRKILLPGQLIISHNGEIIWTLLGSCLSIVFYNPRKQISAVCHAQLPSENSKLSCANSCPEPCGMDEKEDFKYVTCSFKHMLKSFYEMGIKNHEINVGLYGGAHMLNLNASFPRVGDKNISMAKKLLRNNNMIIHKEDLGGNQSRTITHFSDTGITLLRIPEK